MKAVSFSFTRQYGVPLCEAFRLVSVVCTIPLAWLWAGVDLCDTADGCGVCKRLLGFLHVEFHSDRESKVVGVSVTGRDKIRASHRVRRVAPARDLAGNIEHRAAPWARHLSGRLPI